MSTAMFERPHHQRIAQVMAMVEPKAVVWQRFRALRRN